MDHGESPPQFHKGDDSRTQSCGMKGDAIHRQDSFSCGRALSAFQSLTGGVEMR